LEREVGGYFAHPVREPHNGRKYHLSSRA